MWVEQEKGNGGASGIKQGIRVRDCGREPRAVVVEGKGHKVETCDAIGARYEGWSKKTTSKVKL